MCGVDAFFGLGGQRLKVMCVGEMRETAGFLSSINNQPVSVMTLIFFFMVLGENNGILCFSVLYDLFLFI